MKKAYIFVADGTEEVEALTVVDVLRRAGVEILMVSIAGHKQVSGAHGILFDADLVFNEKLHDADMLILPGGGKGTQNLMRHAGLKELLLTYSQEGKELAAICAAPGVLGIHGILKGKHAVCYPGCEDNLKGAIIEKTPVVEDGTIITSMGPGTAMEFALALTKRLCGNEKMQEIKSGLLYHN